MIKITQKGDFSKFDKYMKNVTVESKLSFREAEILANECVDELKKATPKDSGITADSWEYSISMKKDRASITLYNTNIQNGTNIAFLLEYGHGTATGGWVEGKSYISPTVRKAYNNALNKKWKEIKRL